ncbi:MAG TPA: hypothetical protein VF458_19980 [Ktedonobacteraceae bacterium]
MSKTKMRCTTCGKWFQSANAKEVTCPDCVQKARKDKSASKAAPQAAPRTPGQGLPGTGTPARSTPLPPKPKTAPGGTSHWFDSLNDVKVSEPEPPPQRPRIPSSPAPHDTHGGPGTRGPGGYRDERAPGGYRGPGGYRDERAPGGPGGYRGPGAYRNAPLTGSIAGGIGQRPRQPMDGNAPPRGPRPGGPGERFHGEKRGGGRPQAPRKPKTAPVPRPKKEKIPPPEPFKPTPEQMTQVEERYKELAIPSEFDGIRSQISQELSIPKKAVKQIVKALRERESIPSWWETQTYKGDSEEKEKIQNAYQPYLPVPPVGVHRKIADELDLKPGIVYQAIKTIRAELNLPPYNDPQLHVDEFEEIKRKAREAREAREAAKAALAAEAAQKAAEAAETGATGTVVVTATEPANALAEQSTPEGQHVEVVAVSNENEPKAE